MYWFHKRDQKGNIVYAISRYDPDTGVREQIARNVGLFHGLTADDKYIACAFDYSKKRGATFGGDVYAAVYLSAPGATSFNSFSRFGAEEEPRTILGFGAAYEVGVDFSGEQMTTTLVKAKGDNTWLEPEELETGLEALTKKHGVQKVMDAMARMSISKKGEKS